MVFVLLSRFLEVFNNTSGLITDEIDKHSPLNPCNRDAGAIAGQGGPTGTKGY